MNNNNNNNNKSRSLGRKALHLADEDKWAQVLSILRDNDDVYTRFRTKETGDYLIHLAAYAACEKHMHIHPDNNGETATSNNQKDAFECLQIILHREEGIVSGATATTGAASVNNGCVRVLQLQKDLIARDGGTALHAALAAASTCSCDNDNHDNSIGGNTDNNIQWMLCVRDVIHLLLEIGNFDPNARIQNTAGITLLSSEDDDDEEDEYDLSYAREAVVYGWNPLVMCIVWASMLAIKHRCHHEHSKGGGNEVVSIVICIMLDLINAGADFNQIMISNTGRINAMWSARNYSISLAYQLSASKVCDSILQTKEMKELSGMTTWNAVQKVFEINDSTSSTIQEKLLTCALTDDVALLSDILSSYCSAEIVDKIESSIQSCVPLPQMIWKDYANSSINILAVTSLCSSVLVFERLLKIPGIQINECLVIQMVGIIFSDKQAFGLTFDQKKKERTCQLLMVHEILINLTEDERQVTLDKLVYFACFSPWRSSFALTALIDLGGDPTGLRMQHCIKNGYTPMHMVAGKMLGNCAIDCLNILIKAGADLYTCDNYNHTPLHIAINHDNYLMIQRLWQLYDEERRKRLLNYKDLISICGAALQRADICILKECIDCLGESFDSSTDDVKQEISSELGKMVIIATSPKSIMGMCHHSVDVERLYNTMTIFIENKMKVNTSAQDDAGFSCLHHLLRDRNSGIEIRKKVFPIVLKYCKVIDPQIVNIQCSAKIGAFTSLHLAYFVGCQSSIDLLLSYGADPEVADSEGRLPHSLHKSNYDVLHSREDCIAEDDWSDVDSDES